MTRATDFLQDWVRENVNAEPYDDGTRAGELVEQCVYAAKVAGIPEPELELAAADMIGSDGGLRSLIANNLKRRADEEVRRLADKD